MRIVRAVASSTTATSHSHRAALRCGAPPASSLRASRLLVGNHPKIPSWISRAHPPISATIWSNSFPRTGRHDSWAPGGGRGAQGCESFSELMRIFLGANAVCSRRLHSYTQPTKLWPSNRNKQTQQLVEIHHKLSVFSSAMELFQTP